MMSGNRYLLSHLSVPGRRGPSGHVESIPSAGMCSQRLVRRVVLRAAIVYLLLMCIWPMVGPVYRAAFVSVGQRLFAHNLGPGLVEFEESEVAGGDMVVHIGRTGVPQTGSVAFYTRRIGYAPTCLALALSLATPAAFVRRTPLLLGGLLVIHFYIVGRIWLLLTYWQSVPSPFRLRIPGDGRMSLLRMSYELLFVSPSSSFVVPVMAWILLLMVLRLPAAGSAVGSSGATDCKHDHKAHHVVARR